MTSVAVLSSKEAEEIIEPASHRQTSVVRSRRESPDSLQSFYNPFKRVSIDIL